MKAAVLHAYDEKLTSKAFVSYEDVADPKVSKPSEVIVRIGAPVYAEPICISSKAFGAARSRSTFLTSWVTKTPVGSKKSARAWKG